MQQDVYVDVLFLINFSMDYLCLYICSKLLGIAFSVKRLALAALLGGIYAAIALFLPVSSGVGLIFDIIMCPIICAIAFHRRRAMGSTMLYSVIFFLISMLLGGIMTALFNLLNRLDLPIGSLDGDSISVWIFALLAVSAAIISLFGGSMIFKKREIKHCDVTVCFNSRTLCLRGLCDSGNLVRDPISGTPVIILDKTAAYGFIDSRVTENYLQGISSDDPAYSSMRIAPISTVSGRSALVILRADSINLCYEHKNKKFTVTPSAYIAIADIGSGADGCGAIVPYSLLRG